tara:strand:+ start:1456 stop:1803 length:348 start_codon:yes stop_codon:yes gene_type:complete
MELTKKLDPKSRFSKADTNGDNILTDEELDAELNREERRIRMENSDKKEDQIRLLIWFQSIATVLFVAILTIPEVVPESRLDHLVGVATTFILSQLGIIGGYVGANAWAKSKEER